MKNPVQKNPQPKLPKLKAFRTIQKHFALMGINPKLMTQSYPINGHVLKYLLSLIVGLTFICVYICYNVDTFAEYTQFFFVGSAGLLVIFALLIAIFKVKKLFEFINHFDGILNTSERTYFIYKDLV